MTRLTWEDRPYEIGLDRGVFYPQNGDAEVWNGLTSVVESPSNDVRRTTHLDGVPLKRPPRKSELSGTIRALSCPAGFYDVLTQRRPVPFGLSYRTKTATSYKIHILYNVLVQPSPHTYEYDLVESSSWEFTTQAVPIPGLAPSAQLTIEVETAYSTTISGIEDLLYGTLDEPARLPTPQEIFEVFEENSILRVIDNGDGSFTIEGPDDAILMIDPTTFQVTWPSAVYLSSNVYTIQSL